MKERPIAFVDIPTLNGGLVHVAATSVFRITRMFRAEGEPNLSRVE